MNALEARIRLLAREEATALVGGTPTAAAAPEPDRVAALEKDVADLRARLERLEKTSSGSASRRTSRKTETAETGE